MNITLQEVKKEDKEKLNKLIQLYLHNISLNFPIEFNSNTCTYKYDASKYFENKNNKAFFITNEKEIVGFMLIDFYDDKNIVQEMFILNNYKRKGYGKKAINIIFNQYKGNWKIKSLPCSKEAEKFWINIVKEYTKDKFNIEYIGNYNRAVITFNNKGF